MADVTIAELKRCLIAINGPRTVKRGGFLSREGERFYDSAVIALPLLLEIAEAAEEVKESCRVFGSIGDDSARMGRLRAALAALPEGK